MIQKVNIQVDNREIAQRTTSENYQYSKTGQFRLALRRLQQQLSQCKSPDLKSSTKCQLMTSKYSSSLYNRLDDHVIMQMTYMGWHMFQHKNTELILHWGWLEWDGHNKIHLKPSVFQETMKVSHATSSFLSKCVTPSISTKGKHSGAGQATQGSCCARSSMDSPQARPLESPCAFTFSCSRWTRSSAGLRNRA